MPLQSDDNRESDAFLSGGEVVLVQCDKLRCLAFRDKYGKWRSPFSKMELTGIVQVIEDYSN